MARIYIRFGDIRRFKGAFYPTICVSCEEDIEEGDPCGKIGSTTDMYCHECLDLQGEPSEVHVSR